MGAVSNMAMGFPALLSVFLSDRPMPSHPIPEMSLFIARGPQCDQIWRGYQPLQGPGALSLRPKSQPCHYSRWRDQGLAWRHKPCKASFLARHELQRDFRREQTDSEVWAAHHGALWRCLHHPLGILHWWVACTPRFVTRARWRNVEAAESQGVGVPAFKLALATRG